jgi:hypothetical protein
MCPFYYSNYQSILFCVESLIKFQSYNDVCVCLSIVLYLLTSYPHDFCLLITVPSADVITAEFNKMTLQLMSILQPQPTSTSMTNNGYGRTVKNALLEKKAYTTFTGCGSERSVLSVEEVSEARNCENEKSIVIFLSPFLQSICNEVGEGMMCLNSERVPWSKTDSGNPHNDLKPDLNIIHRAMVCLKEEGGTTGKPV